MTFQARPPDLEREFAAATSDLEAQPTTANH